MTLEASIIIPVLDQEDKLGSCLQSVLDQDFPKGTFEVIVVDNGSTDRTREVAAKFPVRLLGESRRSSYAARNRGVAAARGRVLAFLDADCRAKRDWLSRGVAAVARGNAEIVAGQVVAATSHIPNVFEIYDRFKYLDQRVNVERLGYAATANLFIRRSVLESLGRFDADLVSGGDRELCMRARDHGLRIGYSQESIVLHVARSTLDAILRKNERLGFGVFQLLRRRPALIVSMLPMLLFMIPRRRFLRDLLRKKPPCTRTCLVVLFLLDWLAKHSMAFGCLKGALLGGRRPAGGIS